MDKEQQVRLNFLDEAQECFDRIESAVLGLSATIAQPEQLDLALRSAHSVKGGAGMMGFMPLSHVAHQIEDFFKILRVRYHSTQIATEVESLLLQGIDILRELSELHRQDVQIADSWLSARVDPIFDGLRQHLGDLQDEDEDKLFAQNESADPGLVMFEEEVETILDEFKGSLTKLPPAQLAEALVTTAEKLLAFGRMADLEPFVQLCESIQRQALTCRPEQLSALCQQALTVWQRSHALVMRGSLEKLPSQLDGFELAVAPHELQPIGWQDGSVVDEVISLSDDPAVSNAALERAIALQLPSEAGIDESELDLAIALQLQQQDELVALSCDELSALNEAISSESFQETDFSHLSELVLHEAIASPPQPEAEFTDSSPEFSAINEAISRQLLSESAHLSSADLDLGSETWVAELETELKLLQDRELTELQSVLADEIELIDRE